MFTPSLLILASLAFAGLPEKKLPPVAEPDWNSWKEVREELKAAVEYLKAGPKWLEKLVTVTSFPFGHRGWNVYNFLMMGSLRGL